MKQKIKYHGQDIFFKTFGENRDKVVFLLHGYLESAEIWDEFAAGLADEYFVVCTDLPGHGDSETLFETQTMGAMAYAVKEIADYLSIDKLHLVGHSMGGYVAMAFRDKFPDRLISYVLFHSTCFADNDEKKINRDREIEMVRQGKKDLIVNINIPRAFADFNLKRMNNLVERAKAIAMKTKDDGIVAALKGMKMRADRSLLLVAGGIPLMFIAGRKDNYIPQTITSRMKSLAKDSTLLILEKSGHMGFIEEKEKSLEALISFLRSADKNS